MKVKRGTTRITILIGDLAFKIPILNRSLKHFVKGWLGNVDERDIWRKTKHPKLCPVYFSLFGLVNVMPRVIVLDKTPFNKQNILKYFRELDIHVDVCSGWKNFGFCKTSKTLGLMPRLVIIDYATCRESSDECSDCDNDCILKK